MTPHSSKAREALEAAEFVMVALDGARCTGASISYVVLGDLSDRLRSALPALSEAVERAERIECGFDEMNATEQDGAAQVYAALRRLASEYREGGGDAS